MKNFALAAALSLAACTAEASDIDIIPLHKAGMWQAELIMVDTTPLCSAVVNNAYGSFDITFRPSGYVSVHIYFPAAYSSPYMIKDLTLVTDSSRWTFRDAEYGSGQIEFWFETRQIADQFIHNLRSGAFLHMVESDGNPITAWPLKGVHEALDYTMDCAAGYYHGNIIDAPMTEEEY